jgi:hypothetical protein
MKFKARIDYNLMQSREAKKTEIEFTFKDILNNPDFTMRELVIPWLQKGNIPEIIKDV